jgi:hypothetical protein
VVFADGDFDFGFIENGIELCRCTFVSEGYCGAGRGLWGEGQKAEAGQFGLEAVNHGLAVYLDVFNAESADVANGGNSGGEGGPVGAADLEVAGCGGAERPVADGGSGSVEGEHVMALAGEGAPAELNAVELLETVWPDVEEGDAELAHEPLVGAAAGEVHAGF